MYKGKRTYVSWIVILSNVVGGKLARDLLADLKGLNVN